MDRRLFLRGAVAVTAGAVAAPGWAAAGSPHFLTAANRADQSTWLVGLDEAAEVIFTLPIPARGHAAAAHPSRPEAVAFARRPGRFAVVLDCVSGAEIARLNSPEGRHFYGHGAFTGDGRYLLTTENDYDGPDGRLGVWDVADGYRRIDDIPSGGIGPHEIIRLSGGGFAVANGGIQTHPSNDRVMLNIPTMQPNLTWLDGQGRITAQAMPPEDQRQNSIRHIAEAPDGRILIALQWQASPLARVPALASATADGQIAYFTHPDTARLKHYAGSIAITADGAQIAVTGPKGGWVLFFDGATGAPLGSRDLPEASGVARLGAGFAVTMAGAMALGRADDLHRQPAAAGWTWDNHLVAIPA